MFTPFGELRKKQLLSKVIDYGIGIGLSNSRELARYIGGDVSLISSEPGCTIFQIIIPFSTKNNLNDIVKYNSKIIPKKKNNLLKSSKINNESINFID